MELGIGMFGDMRPQEGTAQQRLKEMIEEIKFMDDLGLDFFGLGEHHREEYAVSVPEMVLAAAASVTKNIKLGSAVSVLSSSDPVRLYQNFATLDLLSAPDGSGRAGRAELVAGRGSFIESFPLFGYDLKDYDALYEEKLRLLMQINEQETITWRGKFRPALEAQTVLPRAVNNHLPIWVAVGGTPASVARAGRLGLPVMFAIIGGEPAGFKPLFEYYKNIYQEAGHDMAHFQVGVHMHSFFGKDSTATADYYYPFYAAQMNRVGASRGWPPFSRAQFEAGRTRQGAYLIGDANEAIDKILALHDMFGLTRFSAHMDVGAPAHKALMESIEIYGSVIAPAVRKVLGV